MPDEVSQYTATFHTHLAAILTHRALREAGISAELAPVPRVLSSSCGTCVRYEAPSPAYECMDRDTQAVYRMEGDRYILCRMISE